MATFAPVAASIPAREFLRSISFQVTFNNNLKKAYKGSFRDRIRGAIGFATAKDRVVQEFAHAHLVDFANISKDSQLHKDCEQLSAQNWAQCLQSMRGMSIQELYRAWSLYRYQGFRDLVEKLSETEPIKQMDSDPKNLMRFLSEHFPQEAESLYHHIKDATTESIRGFIPANIQKESIVLNIATLQAENSVLAETVLEHLPEGTPADSAVTGLIREVSTLCTEIQLAKPNETIVSKQYSLQACQPALQTLNLTENFKLKTEGTRVTHSIISRMIGAIKQLTRIEKSTTNNQNHESVNAVTNSVITDFWQAIELASKGHTDQSLDTVSKAYEKLNHLVELLTIETPSDELNNYNADAMGILYAQLNEQNNVLQSKAHPLVGLKECRHDCTAQCSNKKDHFIKRQLFNTQLRSQKLVDSFEAVKKSPAIKTESFLLLPSTKRLLHTESIDSRLFKRFTGNQFQLQLHANLLEATEKFGLLKEGSNNQHINELASLFCSYADIARESNQSGNIPAAFHFSEICWRTLEYGDALALGILDGFGNTAVNVATSLRHPIQTAEHLASFIHDTATFIGNICTPSINLSDKEKATFTPEFITVLEKHDKTLEGYRQKFQTIAEALKIAYEQRNKIDGPLALRKTIAFGIEVVLTPKVYAGLFKGASQVFGVAAIQVQKLSHNIKPGIQAEEALATAEGINIKIATEATNILEKSVESTGSKIGSAERAATKIQWPWEVKLPNGESFAITSVGKTLIQDATKLKEAISKVDPQLINPARLETLAEELKHINGALGKDGPLTRILNCVSGATKEKITGAKGAVYELEKTFQFVKIRGINVLKCGRNFIELGIEFDIETITNFIECKDINWGEKIGRSAEKMKAIFLKQRDLASQLGKPLQIHSKQPYTAEWKIWFTNNKIPHFEG